MRIGIITYHCRYNYGAVLQAYALSYKLKKMGNDVRIIDFKQSRTAKQKGMVHTLKRWKIRLGNLYNYHHEKTKRARFNQFVTFVLPLDTRQYDSKEELHADPPIFDMYITGSDQVWSTDLCGDNIGAYLLDFVPHFRKKVSYAASFGKTTCDRRYRGKFSESLKTFDNISVREQSGREIVRECSGRSAEVVLDPVFLLDSEEWSSLIGLNSFRRPYLLLYTLQRDQLLLEAAKLVAGRNNCDVIHVPVYSWNTMKLPGVTYTVRDAGPQEFFTLLAHAQFVCTNSFHGTSLSIIMRKPFVCTMNKPKPERIEHLLQLLNVSGQGISCIEDARRCAERNLTYDYSNTEQTLIRHKERAETFLKTCLSA